MATQVLNCVLLLKELLYKSKGHTLSLNITPQTETRNININVNIPGVDSVSYLINGRSILATMKYILNDKFNKLRLTAKNSNDSFITWELDQSTHSPPSPPPLIKETITDGLFNGLTIEAELSVDGVSVKELINQLHGQLQLLSIINPQMTWLVSVRGDLNIQWHFVREPIISIRNTPFKILSSVKHYISDDAPLSQSKLKLYRGQSFTISNYTIRRGGGGWGGGTIEVDLKVYSCISVLPGLRLSKGKKVPADRVCNELHVNVFTTGNIPLFSADSSSPYINIDDIAVWLDYGIAVVSSSNETRRREDLSSGCISSFSYPLKMHRACSLSTGRYKKNRIILVLLFIELMFPPPSLSVEEEWNRTVTVLTSLRNEFPSLLQKYSSKFHKTTQDALNKVFCNYSSYRKITDLFSSSIPLLSEAISDIHRMSNNDVFKQEVLELLGEEEERGGDVERELLKRFNSLAAKHTNSSSDERGKEVPTTPELLASISGDRPPSVTDNHVNGTNAEINDTEINARINDTETRISVNAESDFESLAIVPDMMNDQVYTSTTELGEPCTTGSLTLTSINEQLHHQVVPQHYDGGGDGGEVSDDEWYTIAMSPSCNQEKIYLSSSEDYTQEETVMTYSSSFITESPQVTDLDFTWD